MSDEMCDITASMQYWLNKYVSISSCITSPQQAMKCTPVG